MNETTTDKIINLLKGGKFYTQKELANLVGVSEVRVGQILKDNKIVRVRPHKIIDYGTCSQCNKPILGTSKKLCSICNKVQLICFICKIQFSILKSDYDRRVKIRKNNLRDKWFCTKKCYGHMLGIVYGKNNLIPYIKRKKEQQNDDRG